MKTSTDNYLSRPEISEIWLSYNLRSCNSYNKQVTDTK